MPDFRYCLSKPDTSHSARAARLAVLWRLTHKNQKEDPKAIYGALYRLQYLWRQRLRSLKALDRDYPFSDYAYWTARNCKPFGVKAECGDLQPPTCKQPICPFCWARRRTVKVWTKLFPHLVSQGSTPAKFCFRSNVTVVSVCSRWVFHRSCPLAELQRQLQACRTKIRDLVPNEGGMTLLTIEPQPRGDFHLYRRTLLLAHPYDAKALVPLLPKSKVTWLGHPRLSDLRGAVAAATQYPICWMQRPASVMARVSASTKGFRGLSFHGCLRAPHRR